MLSRTAARPGWRFVAIAGVLVILVGASLNDYQGRLRIRTEAREGKSSPMAKGALGTGAHLAANAARHVGSEPAPSNARPGIRVHARDESSILMSDTAMRPYATILSELHLPAKQMTFLKVLIAERAQSSGDSEALSKDVGLNPADTALARSEAEAAFDGDITEAVGDSNAERILQMLSLEPQLAEISQTVGSDAALIDEPLTGEQTLELAQAYREAYAEPSPGSDRLDGFDPQTGLATADKKLVARAQAFLTPTQAAILRINLARNTSAYFRTQD